MSNYAIFFFFAIIFQFYVYADDYPRNHDIDIINYTFRITLSDSTDDIIGNASVEIRFCRSDVKEFELDIVNKTGNSRTGMTVSSVSANNKNVVFSQSPFHLLIKLNEPPAINSTEKFTIVYSGIPSDGLIISRNKYGDRTFFGDNWPDRARYWLPTIDHPYDKATCDFYITAPDKYQAIANGTLVESTDLPAGLHLTHWKETVPIPTKVMVIGVARFAIQYLNEFNCIPLESWVYPQDKKEGFLEFSRAANIVKYFTSLIGPFPFSKLAEVESKTVYGGMENAGNIFYSEDIVNAKDNNQAVIAHEIAHQWFGDAVSENDWNHIWLSEGFATYFEYLFIEHQFGRDSLYNVLKKDAMLVFKYDQEHPGSAIVDTNIVELNELLNPNTYQKAALFLRMLNHMLGKEIFWSGIRKYYEMYKYKNALTEDFESVMEMVSGRDLRRIFSEWIYNPGLPDITMQWNFNKRSKKLFLKIDQVQKNNYLFQIPVDLEINLTGKKNKIMKILQIDKKTNVFSIKLNEVPNSVILDPGHYVPMQIE